MFNRIGFMQGRLSKITNNKIQSFPWSTWKKEIKLAGLNKFKFIEWTVDYPYLNKNPLFDRTKHKIINNLLKKNKVQIKSLTADSLMQNTNWKKNSKFLIKKLEQIIFNASKIGIRYIIFPLVDNSSIKNKNEKYNLYRDIKPINEYLKKNNMKILFESDLSPRLLKQFISNFDKRLYGINYDTGNSNYYGYNPQEELYFYGKYINNIHIKDSDHISRTLRLGSGTFNFKEFFKCLKKKSYAGIFILQTARSKTNSHLKEIILNRNFLKRKMKI